MGTFAQNAAEYFLKVANHIYEGNEIRSDVWMDVNEKQEMLKHLDKERTIAHNNLIKSFYQIYGADGIENRTQLADKVAMMVFEKIGIEVNCKSEGSARDELAELLHKGKITCKEIVNALS